MKNFISLIILSIAMSTLLVAQSSSGSVEDKGYVGIGYSYMSAEADILGLGSDEVTGNAVTFIAGAEANEYFAIEFRYSTTIGDLDSDYGDIKGDMSNVALYLKPMVTIQTIKLYGLIGYGQVRLKDDYFPDSDSEEGFQWGLGMSLPINESWDVFVDYTSLYDDAGGFGNPTDGINITIDSWTFGTQYNF